MFVFAFAAVVGRCDLDITETSAILLTPFVYLNWLVSRQISVT